jgi:hypothetical protein
MPSEVERGREGGRDGLTSLEGEGGGRKRRRRKGAK